MEGAAPPWKARAAATTHRLPCTVGAEWDEPWPSGREPASPSPPTRSPGIAALAALAALIRLPPCVRCSLAQKSPSPAAHVQVHSLHSLHSLGIFLDLSPFQLWGSLYTL